MRMTGAWKYTGISWPEVKLDPALIFHWWNSFKSNHLYKCARNMFFLVQHGLRFPVFFYFTLNWLEELSPKGSELANGSLNGSFCWNGSPPNGSAGEQQFTRKCHKHSFRNHFISTSFLHPALTREVTLKCLSLHLDWISMKVYSTNKQVSFFCLFLPLK